MKRKTVVYLVAVCMAAALLAGCGSQKQEPVAETESAGTAEAEEQKEAPAEEQMAEYTLGSLTVSLPEGFEGGEVEQEGMGTHYELWKGNICFSAGYFGPEDYEAAGVPMPADVEEYSQRSGVQQSIPEGTEFAENEYGSFCAEYTWGEDDDNRKYFFVLLKGKDGMWSYGISAPEQEYDSETFARWAGSAAEK